jgi:hypothetical protein
LTFLTDDSSQTGQHAAAVLPHEAQDEWIRPYRPGPYRIAGAALLLMLVSYLLFAALVVALSGEPVAAGIILAAAVLMLAYALRLVRVGIWVSEHGVRQVSVLKTRTVPWEGIASIRTSQQPVRWLGLPRTLQGQAVLITCTGGEVLRPLLTDHNADFLGRGEAFDMAADRVEDWAYPAG